MDISSVKHQLLHLVAAGVLGHALQIPGLLMHLWFIRNGVWNTYSFLVASEWKRKKIKDYGPMSVNLSLANEKCY